MEKDAIRAEMKKYNEIREKFFALMDENIPQKEGSEQYDFSTSPTLDAQAVYERFFELDYQARKIRAIMNDILNGDIPL